MPSFFSFPLKKTIQAVVHTSDVLMYDMCSNRRCQVLRTNALSEERMWTWAAEPWVSAIMATMRWLRLNVGWCVFHSWWTCEAAMREIGLCYRTASSAITRLDAVPHQKVCWDSMMDRSTTERRRIARTYAASVQMSFSRRFLASAPRDWFSN